MTLPGAQAPTALAPAALPQELMVEAIEARRHGYGVFVVELPWGSPDDESGTWGSFLVRTLTMEEFESFASLAVMGEVSETVLRSTVLYPKVEDWDEHPIHDVVPGSYEELAGFIVDSSGYENREGIKHARAAGRHMASNVFSAAHMFICRAFPAMTPQACRKMDMVELFRYVAMAEEMMSTPDQPVQFPLAEMMGDRQAKKQSRMPDIESLPVLTDGQVQTMKEEHRIAFAQETARRQRDLQANPDAAAARREAVVMRKRMEIANQRAAEEESEALRREAKGLHNGRT